MSNKGGFYFTAEIEQVLTALDVTNHEATTVVKHPEMVAYRKGYTDALRALALAFGVRLALTGGAS